MPCFKSIDAQAQDRNLPVVILQPSLVLYLAPATSTLASVVSGSLHMSFYASCSDHETHAQLATSAVASVAGGWARMDSGT